MSAICRSRKQRKYKQGYLQCTHFTHQAKFVRQHEQSCQCFQHRFFRSIFQWQIVWSALMNPPKMPNIEFLYSRMIAAIASRIALGINSITANLLGEPLLGDPSPGVVPIFGISAEVKRSCFSKFCITLKVTYWDHTIPSKREPNHFFSYLDASFILNQYCLDSRLYLAKDTAVLSALININQLNQKSLAD